MTTMRALLSIMESRFETNVRKTLPEIKAEIIEALHDNALSESVRETLLTQYGVLDDMDFDQEGNLVIWRAINVTPEWIRKAKPGTPLGIYWAHSPDTASPYDAALDIDMREVTLLVQAVLPARFVDWELIWDMHQHGENEVRLFDNEKPPLRIIAIWIDGKPTSRKNWIGKTYTA